MKPYHEGGRIQDVRVAVTGLDLRPGGAPPPPGPAMAEEGLSFTPAADAGGTDRDVLMGYQMFLGRDPETSFVIADAKTSPVGAFLRALISSGEFQSSVLDRLAAGRPLPHEAGSSGPSQPQLDWLFTHIRLPPRAELALRGRQDWRDWLRMFTNVPGVPRPPGRAAPADAAGSPPPGLTPQAAGDGFVLITVETPKPGEKLQPGAVINGHGWAIAPSDITEVAIFLDDTLLTHARYGLPRPDVARSFPHYRHVDHCGFTFTAEIPAGARLHAESRLAISVRTARGETGRKAVRLRPPSEKGAAPQTAADAWPIRLNVEEALVGEDRVLRILGWVIARSDVASVTIHLGDTQLGTAELGLARPDIASAHPSYPNAAQAGFVFVHEVPEAVPGGPGFVRVQAADAAGQTRQAIIPLTIPRPPDMQVEVAAASTATSKIRCSCDSATLSAAGALQVEGWALAPDGIAAIDIELDGIAVGEATLGRPRPDVGRHFRDDPGAAKSGFVYRGELPRRPSSGVHNLTLRVVATDGTRRLVEHPVVTEAASFPGAVDLLAESLARGAGSLMRLEIDQPVLEGDAARDMLRGALTISGWAVAKSGIEEITIFAGTHLLGRAYLGMRREDIGSAFPDYPGSLLSGWALVLPPGALEPGRHLIRVVARAADAAAATSGGTLEASFTQDVAESDSLPAGMSIRRAMPPAEQAFALRLLERRAVRPAFHLLIVQRPEEGPETAQPALEATLASLHAQAYPDWTAEFIQPFYIGEGDAQELAHTGDPLGRISVRPPARPEPVAQKNARGKRGKPAPASPASPETPRRPQLARHVLRLRAGDILGCDALLEFATAIATDRLADFLYADDVRADTARGEGKGRLQPFLKPDWSPDLLHGMNYVGRLWCAAPTVLRDAGLTEAELLSLADYDAVLRLTEQAGRIRHVSQVLGQACAAGDSLAEQAASLALSLERHGIAAAIEPGRLDGTWRVRRRIASGVGRVSVIIPTRAAGGLIRTAIKGLRATSFPARPDGCELEIVILDNVPARDTKTKAWLARNADIVIDMPGVFNWSKFNNAGARAASGDYLLFLNDDIEIHQPDWLEAMLEHASRPEVGVVGARLLYPDGKVQHAGQYLADTHARHAFRFADGASPGPFGLATVAREMISVTGACQMIRAQTFRDLGGFDEAHSVVNNDLDFCLRCWRAGLAVIYTPHATLTHHELASRAALEDSYDESRFAGAWRTRFIEGDPFRNRRLGIDSDHYGIEPEPTAPVFIGRRGPVPESIRRILAVKLDHIGDFLTALPALRSLKRRFPNATIDLLAPAATAQLAAAQPMLAETVVFDFFHARSGDGQKGIGEAELTALQARLAPRRYDLAIDLRMQPETRVVLPYTGATWLVGYDRENRFPFLDVALEWEGDMRLAAKRGHISERLVQLVAALEEACRAEPLPSPATALKPDSVPALAKLPKTFRTRPLVCLHPGVGNVVRQWPAAQYAALIDLLVAEAQVHVVLIGAAEEAPIAEDILRRVAAHGAVESLVGRVKLAELPEVMRACVLFVGNNSGPQHLAASLGLPTIGIHSGVVDAAEWAPLGAQAMALRRRMVCGPCYLEFASDCPRDLACLTGLRPRDVFAACQRLLG